MIEKKIYYVWVGDGKKPNIFYQCHGSWCENLKNYKIIEINEKNFDMERHLKENRFFRECYERKLWAYVSDYIRVHYMYENGGIYLDTDMEIIKDISPLLKDETEFFLGYENEKFLNICNFLNIEQNTYFGDINNILDGKKLKINDFETQTQGIYLLNYDKFMSVIQIMDDTINYTLNKVEKC